MPDNWTSLFTATGWANLILLVGLALVPTIAYYTGHPFWIDISTRLVILAIAAVSLNLVLGYGGMISFGHAGVSRHWRIRGRRTCLPRDLWRV